MLLSESRNQGYYMTCGKPFAPTAQTQGCLPSLIFFCLKKKRKKNLQLSSYQVFKYLQGKRKLYNRKDSSLIAMQKHNKQNCWEIQYVANRSARPTKSSASHLSCKDQHYRITWLKTPLLKG